MIFQIFESLTDLWFEFKVFGLNSELECQDSLRVNTDADEALA